MPAQTKPQRVQLTAERLEEIHFIAGTLVQDFFWLLATAAGNFLQRIEQWLVPLDPAFRGGWVYGRIRRGELAEGEILPALCEEIQVLFEQYNGMETHHKNDWTIARGQGPVRWKGGLYTSGYAAIFEVCDNIVCVIERTRGEWSKGDYRTLVTGLRKIVGDADLNDLVVYAEQELAVMMQGAQGREEGDEDPFLDPFLNASVALNYKLNAVRLKDIHGLRRYLEAHPEIPTNKPSSKRLRVHAAALARSLQSEREQALAAEKATQKATSAYLSQSQKKTLRKDAK
jgi:hypothetical protein